MVGRGGWLVVVVVAAVVAAVVVLVTVVVLVVVIVIVVSLDVLGLQRHRLRCLAQPGWGVCGHILKP